MNTTAAHSEIVSTRTTFDGVTVHLHADGSVSDRERYLLGGKLPTTAMWRVWADICLYTHAEIPALIRSVKKGTWVPFCIHPAMTEARHEAILSGQVRRHRMVNAHGCIVPVR